MAKKLDVTDEEGVDIVKHKHLLMFVHAPTQFEVSELIALIELGFHKIEQEFKVVCAKSFSPPTELLLIQRHGELSYFNQYFKQFGKGQLDNERYNDCKRHLSLIWLGYFCVIMMVNWQLFLQKIQPNHTHLASFRFVMFPRNLLRKSQFPRIRIL